MEIFRDRVFSGNGFIYVTGKYALSLDCGLETIGGSYDLDWVDVEFRYTAVSVFETYGLEYDREIPGYTGKFVVVNHLRAILDLFELGDFEAVNGMRKLLIGNEEYTPLVFKKVLELQGTDNWRLVDEFMEEEYRLDWLNFKGRCL